jgi:hypothetical protein
MDIIPLTRFNGSTIYFMSCHGSSILFTEVLYAGCMVLELMFQIYLIPLPRSAILFKEVWYAKRMVIGLLLQF